MRSRWSSGTIVLSVAIALSGCGALKTKTALPPGVTTTTLMPPPTTAPVDATTTAATAEPDVDQPEADDEPAEEVSATTLVASQPPTTLSEEDRLAEALVTADPVVDDEVECDPGWTPLGGTGDELTFARRGGLFTLDLDSGEVSCLVQLTRDPRRLDWNPAGDLLLVDEDLIVSADEQRPSGFAPGAVGISWSQPTGGTLLAPSADGSALRKIDADDPQAVTDVTALATTWAAAYHPSGQAIVSAGIDRSGTVGVFISDNRGNGATPIVVLEDRSTSVTDVAVAHNGNWITFVHDVTEGDTREEAHIHRVHLTDLPPERVPAEHEEVPVELIASEQLDGSISWREVVDDQDEGLAYSWSGIEPRDLSFPDAVVEPVGFLAEGTAAAVVLPEDAEGGGQLWTYPPDAEPVLIARDVTAAATRTIRHDAWSNPPTAVASVSIG